MSGWESKQIGHYLDYEMVPVDDVVNKQCYILKCETDRIENEEGDTILVHFLVHLIDDNKTFEVRTGAKPIVRTITTMTPQAIKELIDKKEITSFIKERTPKGFTYKMI